MSNRRKMNPEPEWLRQLAAELDGRRDVRAAALAQIVAAYHGDRDAIRRLMPRGDDPEALALALVTAVMWPLISCTRPVDSIPEGRPRSWSGCGVRSPGVACKGRGVPCI